MFINLTKSALVALVLLVAIMAAGCGGGGGDLAATTTNQPTTTPVPSTGTMTVVDNVTVPVSDFDIAGLQRGDALRLRLNRADTAVLEVDCTYLSTIQPEGLYACRSSAPIGPGDSGSPVILEVNGERKVLGALAFGYSNDAFYFEAQPIGRMLGLLGTNQPSDEQLTASADNRAIPVKLMRGLTNERYYQLLTSSHYGEELRGWRLVAGTVATDSAQPDAMTPTAVTVMGGQSLAIPSVQGDVLDMSTIGTITWANGSDLLAFGHRMNWTGPTNLPTQLGTTYTLVGEPGLGYFKLASSTGISLGALVNDRSAGIAVNQGVTPATHVLTVETTVGSVRSSYRHTMVGNDGDLKSSFSRFLTLLACLDKARDRVGGGTGSYRIEIQYTNGSASTSRRTLTSSYDLTLDLADRIDQTIDGFGVSPGRVVSIRAVTTLDP